VGEKVFVTCWSGYGDGTSKDINQLVRHLVCVSKTDGKILWDKTVPAVQPEDEAGGMLMEHGYASSTPTSATNIGTAHQINIVSPSPPQVRGLNARLHPT
jgi:hypothetical protein